MFGIIDNVLVDPKAYVKEVLNNPFVDVSDGVNVFKGIQPRSNDEFEKKVLEMFDGYEVAFNFIRQSPLYHGGCYDSSLFKSKLS